MAYLQIFQTKLRTRAEKIEAEEQKDKQNMQDGRYLANTARAHYALSLLSLPT
jgi:hypothetical protein